LTKTFRPPFFDPPFHEGFPLFPFLPFPPCFFFSSLEFAFEVPSLRERPAFPFGPFSSVFCLGDFSLFFSPLKFPPVFSPFSNSGCPFRGKILPLGVVLRSSTLFQPPFYTALLVPKHSTFLFRFFTALPIPIDASTSYVEVLIFLVPLPFFFPHQGLGRTPPPHPCSTFLPPPLSTDADLFIPPFFFHLHAAFSTIPLKFVWAIFGSVVHFLLFSYFTSFFSPILQWVFQSRAMAVVRVLFSTVLPFCEKSVYFSQSRHPLPSDATLQVRRGRNRGFFRLTVSLPPRLLLDYEISLSYLLVGGPPTEGSLQIFQLPPPLFPLHLYVFHFS